MLEDNSGRRGVTLFIMKLDYGITKILNLLALVAAAALTLVMLLCVVDVVGSKLFNHSLAMAYETTEMLSIPIVYLAIGSVIFGRGAMKIDALLDHLPKWAQTAIALFGNVAGMVVSWITLKTSWVFTLRMKEMFSRTTGVVQLLKWPFGVILCFGWFTVALGCLFGILRIVLRYPGPEPGVGELEEGREDP